MPRIIPLLEHYPPYQLVHAAEMLRDTFEQFYQQRYQLTVPQWRLMMVLGPHYPISQKELVETSGMDKVRISREIRRLVAKGILFTENDEQDKRISLVSLTHQGLALFVQLKEEAGSWQHTLTDYLPGAFREAIRQHLHTVSSAIEQLQSLDKEPQE
ncbi:MarR family winged helix-turn-helix transcriptional regulator [Aeromonas cavernicola]|uniref:MarR family transcriptional regulator n=1 Tax=Aeromonas cavernicola TaxID=1006623 RepID=A0A2H9U3F9_9GAMM|nr:MarR family winged helix-turn-helix transcriptional regulator [Aeromonas cavernicola]PJG58508.1 MarR family transcriptional regulator [Aeromonas cavernicola]